MNDSSTTILTFKQIVAKKPSFSNPIKLSSTLLKNKTQEMKNRHSFEYVHSEVYVVGFEKKNMYLDLIDRNGNRNYLYCGKEESSFYYDSIVKDN